MIWFLLSILMSSCIYFIFKLAGKQLPTLFPMVVFNYAVCMLLGLVLVTLSHQWKTFSLNMLIYTCCLGVLFITTFHLMGKTTQLHGVPVASIVSRVSLVIPFIYFSIIDAQLPSWIQVLGLVLAVLSIVLSVSRKGTGAQKTSFWLPIAVFFGYGFVDILLKLTQESSGGKESGHLQSLLIFAIAGLIGFSILKAKKIKTSKQSIKWAVVLGLVNYLSIFFFFLAIKHSGLNSRVLFPLNGVLILLFSTLFSAVFLGEKMHWKKWLGVSFALVAIYLFVISNYE